MTIAERAVAVRQLPGTLNAKQQRIFLREIQASMNDGRPRVVLDCSNLREWNRSVAFLVLCCLEEAMKRNGDIKLAALPAGVRASREFHGVSSLFDVYDTTVDAVTSFHQLPAVALAQTSGLPPHPDPESAV